MLSDQIAVTWCRENVIRDQTRLAFSLKFQEVKKDKLLLISWRSSTLNGSFLLIKSRFILYQFFDMLWFASACEFKVSYIVLICYVLAQKIIYVMFPCWLLNPGNNISRYLLISESLASLALVDFGTVFLQLKNKLQLLTVGIGGVGLVWAATFTCPPFVRIVCLVWICLFELGCG